MIFESITYIVVYQEMMINIESKICPALEPSLRLMANFGAPSMNLVLPYFNHVGHFHVSKFLMITWHLTGLNLFCEDGIPDLTLILTSESQ